jgi:GNAT superfamily N-acetyltransferase
MSYERPRPLAPEDPIDGFRCRSAEQTAWLHRHARQSVAPGATRVLVVTTTEGGLVVGYYAWTMAQIDITDAPERLGKGAGRYPQPVALLARLGVSDDHEGGGIGRGLLLDVMHRAAAISEDIGCRGLLAHAESEAARDWYLHLLPELAASPTDPLHLALLLKDIRRTLQG